jgi:predicted ATP-binding protein involved in virulence
MKLSKIHISNYKGFKSCSVELHPKVNVFIGSNASGKTTMLTAILKSLYSVTSRFAPSVDKNKELSLKRDDINYESNFCSISTKIVDFPGYERELDATVFTAKIRENSKNVRERKEELDMFVNSYADKLRTGPFTLPIFKFYPANRGGLKYAEQKKVIDYITAQFEAWANIYQDTLTYSRFFSWFFENETDELRLQRDKEDFTIQSPVLKDVRLALARAFEYLGYGVNIRVKSGQTKAETNSRLTPNLILENTVTKQEEFFDNKSDGEKAIVSLVADIAYNLSLAKDFSASNDFLASPGVVLIDEVETHLHPNWQRHIVPMITSIFPNVQLFVATHSPQVVGSVTSDSVFICDKFNISKVTLKTLGEDTNSLLNYIFDATDRPQAYTDLRKHFFDLIERNADYLQLEEIIKQIQRFENEDGAKGISNLSEELNLQLQAYKFDREYETGK